MQYEEWAKEAGLDLVQRGEKYELWHDLGNYLLIPGGLDRELFDKCVQSVKTNRSNILSLQETENER